MPSKVKFSLALPRCEPNDCCNMFQSRYFVASLMVVAAVASRILPHPPNFTPLLAVSLFSGAFLTDKRLAYGVPLLAMLLSDLYFGFHSLMPVIYLCMALGVYSG